MRKRGRRKELTDPVRVSVQIESAQYDEYYRLSREAGHKSVARVIRERAARDLIRASQITPQPETC